jgi:PEP-CTERM motif-containing protein
LNFRSTFFGILIVFALALFVEPRSQAQTILGPTVSLASLTNGSGILVGDKFFNNFTISGTFNASQVSVTGIKDSFGFGIQFGGALIAGNSSADLILGYNVTVVTNAPLLISDAHLRFNGTVVGGSGLAEVVEQVYNSNSVFLGQMFVFDTPTTNQLESTLLIQPPQQQLILSKDVLLSASISAFSSISTIDQTYSQSLIPEPSAFALSAAGLAGLFLLRRRTRSSRRLNG